MSFLNNIVNEFDIALKTLSNKKSGTGRTYPPEPAEKNSEEMTTEEKTIDIIRLIEDNPITRFSASENTKIVEKCKQYFNTTEILNRQSLHLRQEFKKKVQEYFKTIND